MLKHLKRAPFGVIGSITVAVVSAVAITIGVVTEIFTSIPSEGIWALVATDVVLITTVAWLANRKESKRRASAEQRAFDRYRRSNGTRTI